MALKSLGKCIYCPSDLFYEDGSTLIKCQNCGETMAVAAFLNKEIRLEEAQQEAVEAKKAQEAAEQEKKEAEQRLFSALNQLADISLSQSEQEERLETLISQQNASAQEAEGLHQLLDALYGNQEKQQDALTELLSAVLQGQETTEETLKAVREVSEKLQQSKVDIFSLSQYLKLDTQEALRLLMQIDAWSKNTSQETTRRLESLQTGSETLQSNLKNIEEKIDRLDSKVTNISNQISQLESNRKQSELRKVSNLYHQAENKQKSRDFNKAEEYYREVLISKDGKDPEVYWRLILCHYCVEYQQDDQGKWLPTILYPSLDNPRDLPDWHDLQKSCENASDLMDHYEKLLSPIEQIIQFYRKFRQSVNPQVFICVKQKEDNHWTTDSDTGSELYDLIQRKDLSVFNSRRTTIPAGIKYEPYIIAALLSAKLMIVVGTTPEHMEARWVKNEWTRFQWLQEKERNQTGKTDRKLVCYLKGMNPEDIPGELNPDIQAIEESATSSDSLKALLRQTFVVSEEKQNPPLEEDSFEDICDQMEIWLALGDYEEASKRYRSLVSRHQFINEPRLHLYALCAIKMVSDFDQLSVLNISLEKEQLFNLARKKAAADTDRKLIEDLLRINRETNNPPPNPPKAPPEDSPKDPSQNPPPEKKPEQTQNPPPQNTESDKVRQLKNKPEPPAIKSIEIESRDGRLDHYLENNHLNKEWIRDLNWPDSMVLINDFVSRLSFRASYEKPLEGNKEEIIWQILTEDGKPFTSEIHESRTIQSGIVQHSLCWWQYTGVKKWPQGVYSIVITVNGSAPFIQHFRVAELNELRRPEKPPAKDQKTKKEPKPDGTYSNPKTGYEKEFVADSGAARKWTAPPQATGKQKPPSTLSLKSIHPYEANDQYAGITLSDLFIQMTVRQLGLQLDITPVTQSEYAVVKWKVLRQDGYVLIPENESRVTLKKGDKWIRLTKRLSDINQFIAGTYHVTASCNGKELTTTFTVVDPLAAKWSKGKEQIKSVKLLVQNAGSENAAIALSLSRSKVKQIGVRMNFKKPSAGSDMLISWYIERNNGEPVFGRINSVAKIPKGAEYIDRKITPGDSTLKGLRNGDYKIRVFVNGERPLIESFTVKE